MLRTRAPCADLLYCYSRLRTRLACVKHAASVRSEPGSNSRLKLVVLKIEVPARSREVRFQNELLNKISLDSLINRTGSGMSHSVVKEQTSCPAGRLQRIRTIITLRGDLSRQTTRRKIISTAQLSGRLNSLLLRVRCWRGEFDSGRAFCGYGSSPISETSAQEA